jgi:hypothetical protein
MNFNSLKLREYNVNIFTSSASAYILLKLFLELQLSPQSFFRTSVDGVSVHFSIFFFVICSLQWKCLQSPRRGFLIFLKVPAVIYYACAIVAFPLRHIDCISVHNGDPKKHKQVPAQNLIKFIDIIKSNSAGILRQS